MSNSARIVRSTSDGVYKGVEALAAPRVQYEVRNPNYAVGYMIAASLVAITTVVLSFIF